MIRIRKIKPQDALKVKRLISCIMDSEFPGSHRFYPKGDLDDPVDYYSGEKESFFVAEKSGRIIGTVGVKKDTGYTALLRRLFVKPRFRGKGCGKKLINKALDFCKKHGYKKVTFHGTDMMKVAQRACMRNGFEERDLICLPHIKMFTLFKNI